MKGTYTITKLLVRKRSENMPIEYKRVGDICDICGDRLPESKEVRDYPDPEPLLCQKCTDEETERKNKECPVCKKPVGVQNLSTYNGKQMCYPCVKKQDKKDKTREQRKKTFLDNKMVWIGIVGIIVTAIGVYIAYLNLN